MIKSELFKTVGVIKRWNITQKIFHSHASVFLSQNLFFTLILYAWEKRRYEDKDLSSYKKSLVLIELEAHLVRASPSSSEIWESSNFGHEPTFNLIGWNQEWECFPKENFLKWNFSLFLLLECLSFAMVKNLSYFRELVKLTPLLATVCGWLLNWENNGRDLLRGNTGQVLEYCSEWENNGKDLLPTWQYCCQNPTELLSGQPAAKL